jgi:hypothetical protein
MISNKPNLINKDVIKNIYIEQQQNLYFYKFLNILSIIFDFIINYYGFTLFTTLIIIIIILRYIEVRRKKIILEKYLNYIY